jgi:Sulfotransferase family
VKICVIAGWARSGSSLLGKLLGQYDGLFDAGEIIQWWKAATTPGWRCGCGDTLPACPIWSKVLADVPVPEGDGRTMAQFSAPGVLQRLRDLPEMWGHEWGLHSGKVDASSRVLGPIYRSLLAASGARVIVDSSKSPVWVELARSLDDADVRMVHLVRDPRATAYSHTRVRGTPTGIAGQEMSRMGPARSTLYWAANHGTLVTTSRHAVGPGHYRRVHYEDLMAEPRSTVEDIMAFLGEPSSDGPFTDDHSATLVPTHNLAGNAMRFDQGPVQLRVDDQWSSNLPRATRAFTLAIAAPVMPLLGYPLRARASVPSPSPRSA